MSPFLLLAAALPQGAAPGPLPRLPPPFEVRALARTDGSRALAVVASAAEPAPLLVWVEGSGAHSQVCVLEDGRVALGVLGELARRVEGRWHVAGVEKRGATFGSWANRGTAERAPLEYTRHATLEHRVADVRLLVDAMLARPEVDPERLLLVGHSEGAEVAAAVAAADARVTHVAFLAGGGAPQFADMLLQRRRELRERGASDEEVERGVAELEERIREILADPTSDERFFQGHAFRRWASFATRSAADDLVRARARLFLAHGSLDEAVPVESFDHLVVRLLCAGRADAVVRRLPGRDHSFARSGAEPGYDGFLEVVDEILAWAAAE